VTRSFVSRQFTLEEEDIIATGTPAGISPIVPGDTVEVEVEKIGVLKNSMIAENAVLCLRKFALVTSKTPL
jgi:2-keto-4-pentenoate hydratase/2-oxohepta-3-ene-1,7-dioic acid hydratase in catechol pathway